MRQLKISIFCLLLLAFSLPATAATYAEIITLSAGAANTGQTANIVAVFKDNAGNPYTPTVGAFAELPAGSGSYYAIVSNMDTTKLPVVVSYTITGSSTFNGAIGLVRGERAAQVADGYTATRGANLDNLDATVSSRGTQTTQTAIKAQTDKIGTTAADSSNVTGIKAKTDTIPVWPTNFATLSIDTNGRLVLTPAEHTLIGNTDVLGATVDGSITVKQQLELGLAVITGKYSLVRDTVAKTVTTTYKKSDGTTTIAVSVASFADTNLTQPTGRTWTFSNL